MQVGDLVWHVDDLADGVDTPGLVTFVCGDDVGVLFADNQHIEPHIKRELTKHFGSDSLD